MNSSPPAALRRHGRPVAAGLVLAGLIFLAYVFVVTAPQTRTFGYDAFAYWSVDGADPYGLPMGALGAFHYAPPIALVADWFSAVDWGTFLWVWTLVLVGTIVWMAGSPRWVAVAFALPFVAIELYHGNIHILLAAAIVLGFKHPWTWSFVLLTKPTSGVGLLWFAARREWRSLAIALGATAGLCVASLVIAPSLWVEYVDFLLANLHNQPESVAIGIPLWLRLPVAALLVIWGARTDRRWTVIISAMLALPVLWPGSGAMLIGLIPELRRSADRRNAARLPEASPVPVADPVPGRLEG